MGNSTAIGYNAKVSQSNSLVLGGTGADAVSVGIGLTAPAYALDVVGDINVTGCYLYGGSGNYGNCPSDRRLKTNIQPFQPVLERVVMLHPVHFEWLLDTSIPFAELQRRAHVNARAQAADKAVDFSRQIRMVVPGENHAASR